jgi:pyridinium-3,5-biscarboxylic acid mononucleotide sulfurtransferase
VPRAGPADGWQTRGMTEVDPAEAPLLQQLERFDRLVVAFSGGVDSSYLVAVAAAVLGSRVTAATAVSPSLPDHELAAARTFAAQRGIAHVEVATDEMERAAYRRNDPDRCWHCKTALFDALEPITAAFGAAAVAVGTVTDDLADHRPGQRAAAQRGVHTPLADAGLNKSEVRRLARARGLPTWDKPAAACLASRVAHGLTVTPLRLSRIEQAESWLRARVGRTVNLRVRDHGDIARIEVDREAMSAVLAVAAETAEVLRGLGWRHVTVDLSGFRSGSLNVDGAGVSGAAWGRPPAR